ncbi:g088 [Yersinia phage phiR1-37]|uniref:hypothetical protein n=1 Tax=Yersinia phage phiR1-37 TaxID=331278 RepID=UPI00022DBD04|nr:hypothetical protein phiR1-37_gp088 [Yersinia phage phiR1-37]CCE26112.1 g088 [Yersinia phage phiR1-37]
MESTERLSYLDNRQLNESVKRIVTTAVENYVKVQQSNADSNSNVTDRAIEALKNQLFLKFTGIDYELLFQSVYLDRKLNGGFTIYE